MFRRHITGYQYLERQIAMRIAQAQRNERRHAGRLPHPALKASVICALITVCLALFLPMCLGGCAATKLELTRATYYPNGMPKEEMNYRATNVVSLGSAQDDETSDASYDATDGSFVVGHAASGLQAGGDPVELLQAAVPLLALLEPTTAVTTAAKPDSMSRLIEILKALKGTK